MKQILSLSLVTQRDNKWSNIFYTTIAILVALAMLVAASGAGSDDFVIEQPLPDWFNAAANVVSVVWAVLVLIPRTRILGATLVVMNMALSMIVNYVVGGVEFFVFAVPYNVITIVLASLLIGHYSDDLAYLFKRPDNAKKSIMGGVQ